MAFVIHNIIQISEHNEQSRKNTDKDIMAAYRQALSYVTDRIRGYSQARGGDYLLAPDIASMEELFLGQMVDMGVLK